MCCTVAVGVPGSTAKHSQVPFSAAELPHPFPWDVCVEVKGRTCCGAGVKCILSVRDELIWSNECKAAAFNVDGVGETEDATSVIVICVIVLALFSP